jgi:hypothetical protein
MGREISMKKIILITLVLVAASMACATFDSLFNGGSNDGTSPLPTPFNTPVPTMPIVPLVPTSTSALPSPSGDPTVEPTAEEVTPTEDLTPTVNGGPSTRDFFTCTGPCIYDGSNHQTVFSEKIKIIYFSFEYENFPPGASYTRWWTKDGVEWARYQCAWHGPESGLEQITLTEPSGLASGIWEVTITIDGEIVLQETLQVEGIWSYWDPAGFFGSCYGKR